MKNRALASLAIVATILTVTLQGADQFGYVYIGLLKVCGPAFKVLIYFGIGAFLPILGPLLAIFIMIIYTAIILTTILALIIGILKREISVFRIAKICCISLGIIMIIGLTSAIALPGDQKPPFVFPLSYFIYPIFLLVISVLFHTKNHGCPVKA